MAAAGRQAYAAHKFGVKLTPDQRKAMLAQTALVRQRLMMANRELRARIEQVLTSDQKAWLASHRPTRFARHPSA